MNREQGTGNGEQESHRAALANNARCMFPVPRSPLTGRSGGQPFGPASLFAPASSLRSPIPRSAQSGYTLLEVLVAFALLAIGLGVLLAILSGGVHAIARASQSTQASLYAESILDTLGADHRLQPGHSEGLFEGGRFRWTLDIEPFTPPVPPPQQANPYTTNAGTQDFSENVMVHVVLRMQWGDRGTQQALRVETLRAYTPLQVQP